MAVNPELAVAYWKLGDATLEHARRYVKDPDARLFLRVHAIAGFSFDGIASAESADYPLAENAGTQYLSVTSGSAESAAEAGPLCAEVGIRTTAGDFFAIVRSNEVQLPQAEEAASYVDRRERVREPQRPYWKPRSGNGADETTATGAAAEAALASEDEISCDIWESEPATGAEAVAGATVTASEVARDHRDAVGTELVRGADAVLGAEGMAEPRFVERETVDSPRRWAEPVVEAVDEPEYGVAGEPSREALDLIRRSREGAKVVLEEEGSISSLPSPPSVGGARGPQRVTLPSSSERPPLPADSAEASFKGMLVRAELCVDGWVSPGQEVTVDGRRINVRSDGTFQLRFSFGPAYGESTVRIELPERLEFRAAASEEGREVES